MSKILSSVKWFVTYLCQLIGLLFGNISWQPPQWLKNTGRFLSQTWLGRKFSQWNASIRRSFQVNPKKASFVTTLAAVILVTALVSLKFYLNYLNSLPQPEYVKVDITSFGIIDERDPATFQINIFFDHDVAQLSDLNKPQITGVSMSPEVAGVWKWASARQLTFSPQGVTEKKFFWPAGVTYTFKFAKNIFAPQWQFETYKYEKASEQLRIHLSNKEFYIDPVNPQIKKIVSTVTSNYPLDVEDFKKKISFQMRSKESSLLGKSGEAKKFSVSFSRDQMTAYLESEVISLPTSDYEMQVSVAEGVRSSRGGKPSDAKLEVTVEILGKYSAFQIESAALVFARNEKYEPEQVIVINTRVAAQSEEVAQKLEFKLLPKDRQLPGEKEITKDYFWTLTDLMPDVIQKSDKVNFEVIPTEEKYSKTHSFKIKTPVERSLLLTLSRGVRGIGEYELGQDYSQIIRIDPYPQELMFMSKGVLLNQSGSKKIPALARNVSVVKVEIARIIDSQINHVLAQMMNEGEIKKPSWSYENIKPFVVETFSYEEVMKNAENRETSYFSVNLEPYIKEGKGLFVVRLASKNGEVNEDRLVMVTDFGIIAKQNVANITDVFVQNLKTGLPVAGANVEVMGMNGISLLTFPTDEGGRAKIPDLKGFKNEKQPIAFLVKKGSEVSYLPYQLYQRTLNYSRFDVGGVYESSTSDKLSAMMFSDRGLYRPGEKVQIAMILRSKNIKETSTDIPLMWTVTNSKGNLIFKEKMAARSFSMSDFSFATDVNSPTGEYTVSLFLIKKEKNLEKTESLGQLFIKVEEFVPDQMKIAMGLSPSRNQGWIQTEKVKVQVNLSNLYGTPAENRKVTGSYHLIPAPPYIPEFKDFQFYTVQDNTVREVSDRLSETTSNAEGYAEFEIDLKQYKGFYLLKVEAEGFQAESGKAVTALSQTRIGHLASVVGYKADGDLSFIGKDSVRSVQIIGVSPEQKKIAVNDLKLVLLERKYISSLLKDAGGNYRYQSVIKEVELKSEDFKIDASGGTLKLPTEKSGDFIYSIRDAEGFQVNRIGFSVMGDENVARSLERSSELQLILNKKDYQAGEEIEVQIKAPYEGAGLIAIERDQVYNYKWFQSSNKSSMQKIKIPEGVDGNAYVTVTMLRSFESSDILISPLSYGVAPFSISLDQHRTQITLKAAERSKPGQNLKIKYSANKDTKMVLYGVDEGILLVAGYKLPDPLSYFFSKKSLQVKTFQVLDLLLPDIRRFKEFAGPGGDGGGGALGSNLNPFRKKNKPPVVFWSGVLSAGPREKDYAFRIPDDFNGSIKIMAVTSGPKGLGSLSRDAISRGDFIISPTLPSVVSPGDEFFVGVNVSNQVEDSSKTKDLSLEVAASPHLEILNGKQQSIEVEPGHEKGFEVHVRALKKLGTADLKFRVTQKNGAKDKEAKLADTVGVRPSVPYMTTAQFGLLNDAEGTFDLQRNLFSEYSTRQISVSPFPSVFGVSLVKYLMEYPYGCTEQLISKAVPYLVFSGDADFQVPPGKSKTFFDQTIAILRQRQTSSGSFGMYSSYESGNTAATLYALQYLLSAKENGNVIPEDLLQFARGFLDEVLTRKNVSTLAQAREYAQAIYFKARMEMVASSELGFLVSLLEKNYKAQWETDSTAAYIAGTYSLYKMEEKGRKLVGRLSLADSVTSDYLYFYDQLARDGQILQIVARHFPKQLSDVLSEKTVNHLVALFQENRYNTFSSAQMMLAFHEMMKSNMQKTAIGNVKIWEQVKTGDFQEIKLKGNMVKIANLNLASTKVKVTENQMKPAFYSILEQGFDTELPTQEIKKGIEIQRSFLNEQGSVIGKLKRGETVEVSLKARAIDKDYLGQVVLVDLFPSGFELVVEARVQAAGEEAAAPAPEEGAAPEGEFDDAPAEEGEPEASLRPEHPLKMISSLLNKAYAQSKSSLTAMSTEFVDYRDDRVVIYASLNRDVTEFRYKLKAINRGQFVVPPCFGEFMYDRQIQYRGMAQKITVE